MENEIKEIINNWFPDHPNKDRDVFNTTKELSDLFTKNQSEAERKLEEVKLLCEKTKAVYKDDFYLDEWDRGLYFGKNDLADDFLNILKHYFNY